MSNDTKTDNDTNRSNDDTNHVSKCETSLTHLEHALESIRTALISVYEEFNLDSADHPHALSAQILAGRLGPVLRKKVASLSQEMSNPRRERVMRLAKIVGHPADPALPVTSMDDSLRAIGKAMSDLADGLASEIKEDSTLIGLVKETRARLAGGMDEELIKLGGLMLGVECGKGTREDLIRDIASEARKMREELDAIGYPGRLSEVLKNTRKMGECLGHLITGLATAVGVAKRDTAVDTLDSIREAVWVVTADLASTHGAELKDDSTLVGVVGEALTKLGKVVGTDGPNIVHAIAIAVAGLMSVVTGVDDGDAWRVSLHGAVDSVTARHAAVLKDLQSYKDRLDTITKGRCELVGMRRAALESVPARLRDKSDDPVQPALDELRDIEEMVLRHGLAEAVDARGKLEQGVPLPVVLGELQKAEAAVDAANRGIAHERKLEAEKWKDVARQSQRDRDEWQARQANAESECTKRMLERDVLGNKLVDALGVPHRTINVAEDLRHNKPLPPGYKDEAEHPLVVRLAEVLTGRPMGTELPDSIVARATAEVLTWVDGPKVPAIRLPPLSALEDGLRKAGAEAMVKPIIGALGRGGIDLKTTRMTGFTEDVAKELLDRVTKRMEAEQGSSEVADLRAEVERWKKAAETDTARADRMEAQALQSAKSASDWKSTAQASQARVETMSDQLKSAEGMLRNLRAGMITALRVHPYADHGDAALISYAKKAADDSAVDGRAYNDGRAEGRADIAAKLRAIIDPEDKRHLSLDGLINAWKWNAASMRIAASTMLARLLHESGRRAVERGENIAEQTTFIEWVDLHARVKQGRTMTACAMLDSMLIDAAPAPAGSTRLSGECLAREIHKCEKAAIESGHTARQHSTTWVPFDELPEAAKRGRMAQAEYLEKRCDLAFFVWDK